MPLKKITPQNVRGGTLFPRPKENGGKNEKLLVFQILYGFSHVSYQEMYS